MIDGFRVDSAALAAHVAAVDALADRTRRAADAARPLRRDAYGLVGQVFAGVADETARTGSRAVTELAEAVRRQADGVGIAHDGYATADHTIAEMLGEFR
jgi:hypothetical protein